MRRLLTSITVVIAVLAPAGAVFAEPDDISKPAAVLRGAERMRPQQPARPPAPVAPTFSTQAREVLSLVNQERTQRGLQPLTLSSELSDAAQFHTENMADDGGIYHTDPDDGSNPGKRISRTGYKFSTWGENIAAGYKSPAAVMNGWMNSPGHCRNVLNPAFTELGVGYVAGGQNYDKFWTQKFARPAGVDRPGGSYDSDWC